MNVYAGTTTSGTPLSTATTAVDGAGTGTGDGTYSVSVPNGDPYTVCVAPGPGGPWTQTYPPPTATCTTDGTNGRSIASLAYPAGSAGNDFGFRHPDATITGTVWKDLDQDGSFVDEPAEEKVSGATVRLYSGSGFVTATTDSDGFYTFTTPSLANYTVCLVKPVTPLGETKPTSGATCPPAGTATDELSVGYAIANLAVNGSAGNDFGLDYPTVTSVCGQTITVASPFGNNFVYEVKIDENSGTKCSASYVMATGPNADPFALLHPVTTGGTAAEVIEKITWTVPAAGQDPVVELVYDDSSPFGNTKTPMILCKVDPRNPSALFDLLPSVTPADILPAGGTLDGTPGFTAHTSCLISATVSAPPPPAPSPAVRIYTAWVYSSVDGWRSTP